LPFRICERVAFDAQETTKYPLLVFLHSNGSRGTDKQEQLGNAPGHFQQGDKTFLGKYACLVVAPQSTTAWNTFFSHDKSLNDVPQRESGRLIVELIEALIANGRIDSDRVYITGLSLGSWGTTDILWPNRTEKWRGRWRRLKRI
jgi:predicted peptidase